MGVAFGRFEPAIGYHAIQTECRTNHVDQSDLALSLTTEGGLIIPSAGIVILDYAEALLPECIEVNILGIPAAFYEEWFSNHVSKYARQFH